MHRRVQPEAVSTPERYRLLWELGRATFPGPGHQGRLPGGGDVEAEIWEVSWGWSGTKKRRHVLTQVEVPRGKRQGAR